MELLSHRELLRIATLITEKIRQVQASRHRLVLQRVEQVLFEAQRLRVLCRQFDTALRRGWSAAAGKVLENAQSVLQDAPYHSSEALGAIAQARPKEASVGDVLAELRQCQEEFDQFEFDPKGPFLSVTTDAIELQDTYLGEFKVELDLSRVSETRHGSMYRVIALDPHPASSNSSVTHPHVSDEHLCEGEASAAIGAAIAEGRFFDFFSLVRSVLTTYNASSPYVSLADWSGVSCNECGYTCGSDDTHYCSSCEEDLCRDCISYCRKCDESTCRSCLEECGACGESICSSCRTRCPDCGRLICKQCHDDKQCPCVQERKEEDDHDSDKQPAQTAAGVPAGDQARAA